MYQFGAEMALWREQQLRRAAEEARLVAEVVTERHGHAHGTVPGWRRTVAQRLVQAGAHLMGQNYQPAWNRLVECVPER